MFKPLDRYDRYLQNLKDRGEDFELTRTTYTRKITRDKTIVMFNDSGEPDHKGLILLNKVRRDAKDYMERDCVIRNSYINFFDMIEKPTSNKLIHKIDIRSAYWNYSRKVDLVTNETHACFLDLYKDEPNKVAKGARLKALGSLATTKYSVMFENGKPNYNTEITTTQPTKPVYMEVCRNIDDVMKECAAQVPGCIYYYWDCMFVNAEFSKMAIDYFKAKEYEVSVGETMLDYVQLGNIGYLISQCDEKMYMTRREDKELLRSVGMLN